ncbi:response regulator transcription factor [Nocardia nova]|uniref:response regulator transcription factor n=1 Tax=Nocardia nova TaxID=37330 RepID=UPI0033D63AFF
MSSADTDRPITVFLVDDHRLVRAGVSAYLAVVDGIDVVGEAGDGREALARLAALDTADRLPDTVLMDITMPGMDGITATREIKRRWPGIEVVAVTSFVEDALIRGALEAGAAGYLLKDADPDDLAAAIRTAVAGGTHLDPTAARILAESVRAPRDPVAHLTPREREVLALVGRGAANRDIARELSVSERTARTHVSAILTKLGLASRTQAALWAVRHGLVPGDD